MYRAGCHSLNSPHSHLHAPPRDSGFCRWIPCSRRTVEADSSLKPVPHERPEMTTISVDPTVPIPMLCHNLQDVRAKPTQPDLACCRTAAARMNLCSAPLHVIAHPCGAVGYAVVLRGAAGGLQVISKPFAAVPFRNLRDKACNFDERLERVTAPRRALPHRTHPDNHPRRPRRSRSWDFFAAARSTKRCGLSHCAGATTGGAVARRTPEVYDLVERSRATQPSGGAEVQVSTAQLKRPTGNFHRPH